MSGYSQNHRDSDKCKCHKSSCNQNRKHNCGCDSCKHHGSCHHTQSNVFYCKEIGRGTIWYPTHHGSNCHETRECCSQYAHQTRSKTELKEYEFSCVLISHKGGQRKALPYIYDDRTPWYLDGTLRCLFITIGKVPYLAIHDVKYTAASELNKTASALLKMEVRGPVIFIHLDGGYMMTHMTTDLFKNCCLKMIK